MARASPMELLSNPVPYFEGKIDEKSSSTSSLSLILEMRGLDLT